MTIERLLRLTSTILSDVSDEVHPECVRECVNDGLALVDAVLELLKPTLKHLADMGKGGMAS